jgi:hypothetical protein
MKGQTRRLRGGGVLGNPGQLARRSNLISLSAGERVTQRRAGLFGVHFQASDDLWMFICYVGCFANVVRQIVQPFSCL